MTEHDLQPGEKLPDSPKKIWLQPACVIDERCWSEDDIGACDECGAPSVEYIRADQITASQEAPPIGGRSIDDRLGEAVRRYQCGLLRPLWADMDEGAKDSWRTAARMFRRTTLRDVGLKLEIIEP